MTESKSQKHLLMSSFA